MNAAASTPQSLPPSAHQASAAASLVATHHSQVRHFHHSAVASQEWEEATQMALVNRHFQLQRQCEIHGGVLIHTTARLKSMGQTIRLRSSSDHQQIRYGHHRHLLLHLRRLVLLLDLLHQDLDLRLRLEAEAITTTTFQSTSPFRQSVLGRNTSLWTPTTLFSTPPSFEA